MIKITIEVEGMSCGMCEAHINEVVRRIEGVKKVISSKSKGRTEVIAEDGTDANLIKEAIKGQGYGAGNASTEHYETLGLFSKLKK